MMKSLKRIKRLKENKNLLIVMGLCVIIVGSVVLTQAGYLTLKEELKYDPDSQSLITFGVYKYEDGEFIPIPVEHMLLSPYTVGGEECAEIAPLITWVSTGRAIDWATFSLVGNLDVKYFEETWENVPNHPEGGRWMGNWADYDVIPFGAGKSANDTWSEAFVLGTDLCLGDHFLHDSHLITDHIGESGWRYAFSGRVTGTVYDVFGNPDPLTDSTAFGTLIVWITYDAWYNVEVSIV